MPEVKECDSQELVDTAQELANQEQEPAQPQGLQQVNLEDRLSELEGFLRERDKEIGELKKSLEIAHSNVAANGAAEIESKKALQEKETALADRDKALAVVLTAYRTAIMQTHPDIPEEMVTGNTLEELQGNLDKAKVLVQKIREKMPLAVQAPAGAPVRSGPDFTAMSSREKIVQGLKGNGRSQ